MKKLILSLAALSAFITLFLCIAMPAHAETYRGICGDNLIWTFDLDSGTLTIDGEGEMDYHFAESPWNNFKTKITTVVISDKVTSIRADAFRDCSSLTSINIPNGVASIGSSAFYGCSSLTSINIPDGVTSIDHAVFNGCSSLTSINIPDGVTSIGNYAFYDCSSLTSINIPDSVTSIGDYAFDNCRNLTSVHIPDSITSIGDYAFDDCIKLTSINIPSSVTIINEGAFQNCTNLKEVHISDLSSWCRITFVHYYHAFSNNEDRVTANPLSYDAGLYLNDELITDMVIPEDIDIINSYAFMGYSKLRSVQFHKNVTCISSHAFYACDDLNTIIFSNGISQIKWQSFSECHSFSKVIFCGTEGEWNSINIHEGWNEDSCEYSLHYHDYDDPQAGSDSDGIITCKYCGAAKGEINGDVSTDDTHTEDTYADDMYAEDTNTDFSDDPTETSIPWDQIMSMAGCSSSLNTDMILIFAVIIAFAGFILKKEKQ